MAHASDSAKLSTLEPIQGLDILLIHAETGISPFMLTMNFPPLGVIELASYLNANGFKARVVDCRHSEFTIEWLSRFLAESKPRWVGISVLTDSIYQATRLTNLVRNSSPTTRVVLGGVHSTMCSEEVLLELEPDAVVRGEGEIPCSELLTKASLADVHGITYLKDGNPVMTPAPPLLDLDEKPAPDYRVVLGYEGLKYHPSVNTGRGCPYRCTFCAAATLSPRVRWRDVGKVIEDIEFVMRTCEGNYLAIFDDTFTVDLERTDEFCREIKKIGGGDKFVWYAEGRVDRLVGQRKLLKSMHDSGLRFLQLGIESGDERVLEAYRKEIRLEDAITLCSDCADLGILTHAGFIVGGPFESPETLERTRNFMEELAIASRGTIQILTACLNPLPGTEIYEDHEKYGVALTDPDLFSSSAFDNAVTETDDLSRSDILRARHELTLSSLRKLSEIFLEQDEAFFEYLGEVIKRVGGPYHNSLRNLVRMKSGAGWDKDCLDRELIVTRDHILRAVATYPQFVIHAGDLWNDIIPARLPFFTMGEDDRYILFPDEELTQIESDVLHFASGKLTGGEIAIVLGEDRDRIKSALESLEQKKAIIYRTY